MAATLEALAARWRAPRRRDFSDSSSDAALDSASAASADSADDSDTLTSSSSPFPVSVADVDFNDGGTAVAGSLFYPARGCGGGAPPPWSPHYYYTYGEKGKKGGRKKRGGQRAKQGDGPPRACWPSIF